MSLNVIPANSESTKRKDKIPEYAKDFRKEWLYIKGINTKCGRILSKIDFDVDDNYYGELFNSTPVNNLICHIKKFLKDQENGRLKDISGFYFKYFDVNNIDCLEKKLGEVPYHIIKRDFFDSDEDFFDFFDIIIKMEFLIYKDFFELIRLINDKIKKESP